MGLRVLRSFSSRLFAKRLFAEELGSEAVEFALSLPVLVMTTFGAIELLLFMSSYVGATYGSRTAVRYASTHGASSLTPCTSANLTSLVQTYVFGIPGGKITITPAWSPNNSVGSTVTVQVSVTYPTGIPFAKLNAMSVTTTASGVILQ